MQETKNTNELLKYAEMAKQSLDELEIEYLSKTTGDKYVFTIPLGAGTVGSIILNLIINESGYISAIYCAIHKVEEDKIPFVLRRLNKINAKYQLFKFYMDADNDVMFQYDIHMLRADKEVYDFEIKKILSIAKISSDEIPGILSEAWNNDI